MNYRGPGFLSVVWFGSSPTSSPFSSASCLCFSVFLYACRRLRYTDGRGGGVDQEPNHTTTRKHGPLQIIQYSILSACLLPVLNFSQLLYISLATVFFWPSLLKMGGGMSVCLTICLSVCLSDPPIVVSTISLHRRHSHTGSITVTRPGGHKEMSSIFADQ